MRLYNALKLKKTYSFTVFGTFGCYSKCPAVFCGVLRFSGIPLISDKETYYYKLSPERDRCLTPFNTISVCKMAISDFIIFAKHKHKQS